VDRIPLAAESAPSLNSVCQHLFCDPNQPQQLADLLANEGPQREREALQLSRLALLNDPASPFRWCDLGDLYLDFRSTADPAQHAD